MNSNLGNSSLEEQYVSQNPTSAKLYQRASQVIAGGITHDIRHLDPFLIYIKKANGSRKWDVDGHEYIDYVMGHGALIMGHEHPLVVDALAGQIHMGTHYGANHELEVEWAELITKMIPSAERVRFTASGTEATMLAIRMCRAATGKKKILRFEGHFHGWHDVVQIGVKPPWDMPDSPGIPLELCESVVNAPTDLQRVDEILSTDPDIACVILEPSGASHAMVPLPVGFLKGLREIASKHNTILIFDEVITGFRYAPGGAQERFGVIPDMTTLAKILAGGLPGGCVAGRADIIDQVAFRDNVSGWDPSKRIPHSGTYNANPVSAAAGVACLKLVANPQVQKNADEMTERLIKGCNAAIKRQGVRGIMYGESSCFNTILNVDVDPANPDHLAEARKLPVKTLRSGIPSSLEKKLVLALLLNGIHMPHVRGWLSTIHTPQDIDVSIEAFGKALAMLKSSGDLH